ncbi:hypothetical protein POM88_050234 [Heracleum sosnowskyi]|uniref:Pyridoxamine kinase/Phosphomethylpyrimidine kinase domain-containing protein n=1 Tax=Heracleum sosnowskyi TaxID=360622 RepID=A0AAD8GYH1_9APIA|nr:hypothetical protein POM88_050234 [Heracleum sosnowskyi]
MLPTVGIVKVLYDRLKQYPVQALVVDPVMVSTSGDVLAGPSILDTFSLISGGFCLLISYVVLLQEKKLLDLPKLLDICAIYGHENEDLTRILMLLIFSLMVWSSTSCGPHGYKLKTVMEPVVLWLHV